MGWVYIQPNPIQLVGSGVTRTHKESQRQQQPAAAAPLTRAGRPAPLAGGEGAPPAADLAAGDVEQERERGRETRIIFQWRRRIRRGARKKETEIIDNNP